MPKLRWHGIPKLFPLLLSELDNIQFSETILKRTTKVMPETIWNWKYSIQKSRRKHSCNLPPTSDRHDISLHRDATPTRRKLLIPIIWVVSLSKFMKDQVDAFKISNVAPTLTSLHQGYSRNVTTKYGPSLTPEFPNHPQTQHPLSVNLSVHNFRSAEIYSLRTGKQPLPNLTTGSKTKSWLEPTLWPLKYSANTGISTCAPNTCRALANPTY